MAEGTAVCAHCAAGGKSPLVKGTIVTPSGSGSVDFDGGDFEAIVDQINLHKRVAGRPVIEHQCPVQGHQVLLYTDIEGVPA